MIGSDCWWDHDEPVPPPDPTPRRRLVLRPARRGREGSFSTGAQCSRVALTSKAPARFGPDDEYAVLDHLDVLVRKSLLVATDPRGTPATHVETIRQFAEDHSRQWPSRSNSDATCTLLGYVERSWPCGTARGSGSVCMVRRRAGQSAHGIQVGGRQRRNRLGRDHHNVRGDPSASWLKHTNPSRAEELIEPARDTKHPRLCFRLCAVAAQCHATGVDDAVAYLEASHQASPSGGFDEVPTSCRFRQGLSAAAPVNPTGGPTCAAARSRRRLPAHTISRARLVMALYFHG